jgi:hypothetical protein
MVSEYKMGVGNRVSAWDKRLTPHGGTLRLHYDFAFFNGFYIHSMQV